MFLLSLLLDVSMTFMMGLKSGSKPFYYYLNAFRVLFQYLSSNSNTVLVLFQYLFLRPPPEPPDNPFTFPVSPDKGKPPGFSTNKRRASKCLS